MAKTTLVWFRQDFRLSDNPAWENAMQEGLVIPIFIWSPEEEAPWAPGAASRWWLYHSLAALERMLRTRGSRLIIRQGKTTSVLKELLETTRAAAVYWNRRYEPAVIERDTALKKSLKQTGVKTESFNAALLYEPWDLKTQAGHPFQVFTPFWNACQNQPEPPVSKENKNHPPSPRTWPASDPLEKLKLLPALDGAKKFSSCWVPGEGGAQAQLKQFLEERLSLYPHERNRPDHEGSSRLSPHLHFGEISPRQVWQAIKRKAARGAERGLFLGAETYLREIGWREFAHHLLYHFPQTPQDPLRPAFKNFPWLKNKIALKRWQQGQTGYPIVDAGLRQLGATGWMHNRVRMIVGSFLVKDLLLPWQEGARWFWDTLVDADLANNTLGWQWIAGCGADAAPYYRIFNPVLQGEKFDPEGHYVRQWVPELKRLPASAIHKPWELSSRPAGYPTPIVDHSLARTHALAALKQVSK